MTEVLYPPLFNHVVTALEETHKRIILMAPYIKYASAQQLIRVIKATGSILNIDVTVVTNVSSTNLLARSSDVEAYELFFDSFSKFNLIGIGNLHAKCYIFDKHTALIGSSNFTPSGLNNNLELTIKITDEMQISDLIKTIDEKYIPQGSSYTLQNIKQLKVEIEEYLANNANALKQYEEALTVAQKASPTVRSKSVLIDQGQLEQFATLPQLVRPVPQKFKANVIKEAHNPFSNAVKDQEWYVYLGQLVAYHERKPDKWPTTLYENVSYPLAEWCDRQRELMLMQKLSAIKLRELKSIGFVFSRTESAWANGVSHLKRFLQENPKDWPFFDEKYPNFCIGEWLIDVRKTRQKGELSHSKIDELDAYKMVWDKEEAFLRSNMRLLKLQRSKKTHWPFPEEKTRGHYLYKWLRKISDNPNSISSELKTELEVLNFPISNYGEVVEDEMWYYGYDKVVAFVQKENRLPEFRSKKSEERQAAVLLQRLKVGAKKKGQISKKEHLEKLLDR